MEEKTAVDLHLAIAPLPVRPEKEGIAKYPGFQIGQSFRDTTRRPPAA